MDVPSRHHIHQPTLTKLIHKLLPLGAQVAKYDKKYPPNCPLCRALKEDLDHFWRCQATTRLAWRRQFLKDLDKKLVDLATGPEVRELVVSKLRAVLDGNQPSMIPTDPSLGDIVAQQERIGWDQLMLGRLGLAWNALPPQNTTQPDKTYERTMGTGGSFIYF